MVNWMMLNCGMINIDGFLVKKKFEFLRWLCCYI